MNRIHVLQYNQWIMNKIGIYSYRLTEPNNEFFKSIIAYNILLMKGFTVILSVAFVYLHWPNFDMICEPIHVIFGAVQAFIMYTSIGIQMKNVKILHLKLQEIVDSYGNVYFFKQSWFFFLV